MRRPISLILLGILFILFLGCIVVPGRGWHGEQDSGRHNDNEERH